MAFKDRERAKAYLQEWRDKNRPLVNKKARERMADNTREGYARRRKHAEWHMEYYRKNRDVLVEKLRERYKSTLSHKIAYNRNRKLFMKEAAINVYTNGDQSCRWCGQCDLDVLCLDHINGNGLQHRKMLNGVRLYQWAIQHDYPPIFQVLCGSCNMKKEALKRRNESLPKGCR